MDYAQSGGASSMGQALDELEQFVWGYSFRWEEGEVRWVGCRRRRGLRAGRDIGKPFWASWEERPRRGVSGRDGYLCSIPLLHCCYASSGLHGSFKVGGWEEFRRRAINLI
jgi:hypothetical protein